MYKLLLLVVVVWGSAEASEKWAPGQCLQTLPREALGTAFLNKPLYARKNQNSIFPEGGRCDTTLIKLTDNGITTKCQRQNYDGTYMTINGASDFSDSEYYRTGRLDVKFDQVDGVSGVTVPFYIVATDEQNYSVVYSCKESDGQKMERILVFTTKPNDQSFDDELRIKLGSIGLDFDAIPDEDHNNCVYQ